MGDTIPASATAEIGQVLTVLNQGTIPKIQTLEPDAARALFDQMLPMFDFPETVTGPSQELEIPAPDGPPIRAELVFPQKTSGKPPLIVFFHGGGFVIGNVKAYGRFCRHLANASGAAVLSVDYRLAPDAPFPAGLEDCMTALHWAAKNAASLKVDASHLFVAGDSAGGNLAAVCALQARGTGGPHLSGQILIYPVTDMKTEHPSRRIYGEDLFLERETMQWFANHYIPDGMDPADWRISPLCAEDLSGLPPSLVFTAGLDPLLDEGNAYVKALADAGVDVQSKIWNGMIHGFMSMGAVVPQARHALEEIGEWVKARSMPS